MRERHRDKPYDGMPPRKCLLIGADEPVGKYLADYLYAQNFDVERVGGKLIFTTREGLANYDYILMAADYVWCDGLAEARSDTTEHQQKVTRIIQMSPLRVRFIYIVPHYLPERWREVEKIFRKSGRDYISLHVPEIVYTGIEAGWLPRLLRDMQAGQPVRIDDMAKEKDFLWLADLGYFVEKLMDMGAWQERSLELTTYRRASNERIIQYLGGVMKLETVDVDICTQDDYACPLMDDRVAVKVGFSSMGTIEMVRRILPPEIGEGLGMSELWFYEREKMAGICYNYIHFIEVNAVHRTTNEANEEFAKILLKQYRQVIVHGIIVDAIGYFCFDLYLQAFENSDESVLHLFVPLSGLFYKHSFANNWLWHKCVTSDLKNMVYLTADNAGFWQYMLSKHNDKLTFLADYALFEGIRREMDYRYVPFAKDYIVNFTADEEKEAICIMEQMGIKDKAYVCFIVRDNAYKDLNKKDSHSQTDDHNDRTRNADIERYRQGLEKLGERGVYSVRMGSVVERRFSGKTIIDYASDYRTEMMDFYLLSQCKFFVGTNTGLICIAMLFRVPMIMINFLNIITNMDHHPPLTPERDLFIPKKIWYKREGRYLTLREMLDFNIHHTTTAIFMELEAMGCEIQQNTPEEIEDVIMEMEDRLEGRRIYTEEEEVLQACYRDILMDAVERSNFHYTDARCGTEFLKKNPWFLN